MSHWLRGLLPLQSGEARVLLVDASQPARELIRRHGLQGQAARLGAEMVAANFLLAAHIKGEERLLLELVAEDRVFTFSGEVSAGGTFRGRFSPEALGEPLSELRGRLAAIKWGRDKELYRGIVALEHPTMEAAMRYLLLQSQQSRGTVRIHAQGEGEELRVLGLLLEWMPEELQSGEIDLLDGWEELVEDAPVQAWSQALTEDPGGERTLLGLPLLILDERQLTFDCGCSRARAAGALMAMGLRELLSMMEEQGEAEVGCHFCGDQYHFDAAELQGLVTQLSESSSGLAEA